ncbi:MAG: DUF6572 domain-containing protein [Deltaproteobacteria bacterium]|nr:DUF6572 domain-containing protein [Deltaproteobacteria bacterium]
MERSTKEAIEGEFGQPGVQNPMMLDLIALDPATDMVVLTMIERRAWGTDPRQIQQIEEKINRYMGYVLDGFLAEQYPQYIGKRVLVSLRCIAEPGDVYARFVVAARQALAAHGIGFDVQVVADTAG